ncbi:MAG TPA: hypothetical protein VN969_23760 [Streptosporangiaceae bacterium]|nr:hypothetical protein [Streptosporangiaceae bacterium]
MALEQASTLITGVTGIAGMLATYLIARYGNQTNLRAAEMERRYKLLTATSAERKSAYVRILHAFEEFIFTLQMLQKRGYGGTAEGVINASEEIHELLDRNLEVDLAIQNIERELELIAPIEVIKACRRAFYSLRELTQTLTDNGELSNEPYVTQLAAAVSLMRLDLGEQVTGPVEVAIDMRSIYELNAPESAIRLRLESEDVRL